MPKHKVLVVEPEPNIRRILEISLDGEGFDVVSTGQSTQALELVDRHKPDAIVLCDMMPELSGVELTHMIRLSGINTPIIMLAVLTQSVHIQQAQEVGVTERVVKPFSPQDLTSRVRELITKHAA